MDVDLQRDMQREAEAQIEQAHAMQSLYLTDPGEDYYLQLERRGHRALSANETEGEDYEF